MSTELLHRRATVTRAVRRFFDERGFVEVDTPVLVTAPAPELHIEAPSVTVHAAGQAATRYLQTSPELMMKRLLSPAAPRLYQIAAVFRDHDFSPLHRPEFRLLEWYRRDAPWESLLDDCEGLLRACARAFGRPDSLSRGGQTTGLSRPFRRVTVDEAFRQHAGFSILDALEVDPLRAQLQKRGMPFQADDDWDDLFHRVFLTSVEPALLADPSPLFLTHYPKPLASLARLSPADPRVSERFELYVCGLELANGFGELVDPNLQRQRFTEDRERRRRAGRADYPLDEHFLRALATLPPSAGIALGLDRLLMLLLGVDDIDAVHLIPWSTS